MAQRLVFAGDSITDAGRDRDDQHSLGDGWVSLVASVLLDEVINRGIAGDRAVDLERRWRRDVTDAHPDVVTIYVGVNDMLRRYDSDAPTSTDEFEATYRRIVAAASGSRIILIEPFFLPVLATHDGWRADLDEKRAVIRRIAEETGAELVLLQAAMTRAAAESGVAAIAPDGVHPTPTGSRIIADAWLRVFESAAVNAGRQ
jgi:lysophospholipase L1-like esterase